MNQVTEMLVDFEKRKAEAEDAESVSPNRLNQSVGLSSYCEGREDASIPRRGRYALDPSQRARLLPLGSAEG